MVFLSAIFFTNQKFLFLYFALLFLSSRMIFLILSPFSFFSLINFFSLIKVLKRCQKAGAQGAKDALSGEGKTWPLSLWLVMQTYTNTSSFFLSVLNLYFSSIFSPYFSIFSFLSSPISLSHLISLSPSFSFRSLSLSSSISPSILFPYPSIPLILNFFFYLKKFNKFSTVWFYIPKLLNIMRLIILYSFGF